MSASEDYFPPSSGNNNNNDDDARSNAAESYSARDKDRIRRAREALSASATAALASRGGGNLSSAMSSDGAASVTSAGSSKFGRAGAFGKNLLGKLKASSGGGGGSNSNSNNANANANNNNNAAAPREIRTNSNFDARNRMSAAEAVVAATSGDGGGGGGGADDTFEDMGVVVEEEQRNSTSTTPASDEDDDDDDENVKKSKSGGTSSKSKSSSSKSKSSKSKSKGSSSKTKSTPKNNGRSASSKSRRLKSRERAQTEDSIEDNYGKTAVTPGSSRRGVRGGGVAVAAEDDEGGYADDRDNAFEDEPRDCDDRRSKRDRGGKSGGGGRRDRGDRGDRGDRDRGGGGRGSKNNNKHSTLSPGGDYRPDRGARRIKRYRGFSTSVSSLFLDESLVCPSVSCFGLLLSQRTEHLLNERNRLRGVQRRGGSKRRRGDRRPSHILSVALLSTIVIMAFTYIVWGFGNSGGMRMNSFRDAGLDYGMDKYYVWDDDEYNDQVQQVQGDDGDDYAAKWQEEHQYDNYGDDDGNNGGGDDDYGNDDANGNGGDDANGDDGNNWYNNNYNNYNNDDGNGDDAAGDDAAGDDAAGDDAAGDDANRNRGRRVNRRTNMEVSSAAALPATTEPHRRRRSAVFPAGASASKISAIHEFVWRPVIDFFKFEMEPRGRRERSPPLLQSSSRGRGEGGGDDIAAPAAGAGEEKKARVPDGGRARRRRHLSESNEEPDEDANDEDADADDDDDADADADAAQSEEWDAGDWLRTVLGLSFLLLLGVVGRRRRMRTRYALLRARAEDDELYRAAQGGGGNKRGYLDGAASGEEEGGDTMSTNMSGNYTDEYGRSRSGEDSAITAAGESAPREDQYEGACSHTLCGCYPVDPPHLSIKNGGQDEYAADDDEDRSVGGRLRKREDCVSRSLSCLLGWCCGGLCKVWIQCFSTCALAQEGREMRLLLPPRLQRVDWLTHQPFHEYYGAIVELRVEWMRRKKRKQHKKSFASKKRGWMRMHIDALSKLSRYILLTFVLATIAVVLTERFNSRAKFDWSDTFVLLCTFLQSFFVLFVIHHLLHKSDLSFDAVVKFFASGFLIAMPTAFIFEIVLINIFLFVAYVTYAFMEFLIEEAFVEWFADRYHIFWFLGELVNSYIVASLTEELCKYYAFRCVEHPDLIILTGLDKRNQDPDAVYGGIKNYSFAGHNVSESRSYDVNTEDDDSIAKWNRGGPRRIGASGSGDLTQTFSEDSADGDSKDVRTLRQRAAAVATAMIGCAVGLACAENFIYVFFFGGGGDDGDSSSAEWGMLLLRSVFPVHALAAAMQSIGVVRKFLEDNSISTVRVGAGKIVLPAVLLHGTFDAVLMCVNVYVDYKWTKYEEKQANNYANNAAAQEAEEDGDDDAAAASSFEGYLPYNAFLVNLIAWISVVGTMLLGLIWYYVQNRNQKARLKLMEEAEDQRLGIVRSGTETSGEYEGPSLDEDTDDKEDTMETGEEEEGDSTEDEIELV